MTVGSDTPWLDRVRGNYANRGLGGRLDPGGRPAVVVVDLVRGFTDPSCPPGCDLDEVVGSTAGLLDRARQLGLPIYFTTIAFDDAELDTLMWLQKMPVLRALRSGTPWVEVDPRLAPRRGEPVVRKKAASAFFGTDLARVLRAAGVDALLICGATTSGCVRASAIDACAWGFPSRVVRECVGDRAPEPHEANLLDIDAKYADVISLETAFSDFDRTVISR